MDEEDKDLLDLGELGVWDLTQAFAKLLEEIGQEATMHVEREKRDVGFYTRRMVEAFKQKREMAFSDVFDRSEGRYGLIGTLIALLEMMKQGYLRAFQDRCFDEIHLAWKGSDEVTADQILAGIAADEERRKAQEAAAAMALAEGEASAAHENGSNGVNGHAVATAAASLDLDDADDDEGEEDPATGEASAEA